MIITERKNGYCVDGEYGMTLTHHWPPLKHDCIERCETTLHITGFWFQQTNGFENKLRSTWAAIRFIWFGRLS